MYNLAYFLMWRTPSKKRARFIVQASILILNLAGGIERIEPATARILAFRLLSCTSSGSVIRTFWAWNFQLNTRSVLAHPNPKARHLSSEALQQESTTQEP